MAWTNPKTWSACEVVTATLLNAHLRDNLNETFPALVTTKGDTVFATGANAGERLAVGSRGRVITANSGCNVGVQWSTCHLVLDLDNEQVGIMTTAPSATLDVRCGADATGADGTHVAFQYAPAGGFRNWIRTTHNANTTACQGFDFYVNTGAAGGTSTSPGTGNTKIGGFYGATGSGGILGVGATGASVNPSMTWGVTINQGGADDEIITLKSSDVAHSFTGVTDQDTFGALSKNNGAEGALKVAGFSDAAGGAAARSGLVLEGYTTNTHTTNATTASGIVALRAWVLSSSTAASPAGADNAFTFVSGTRTCVIIDGAGELHLDAGSNASAFDHYADAALLRSFAVHTSDPATVIHDQFVDWMRYQREDLERLGLVEFNDGPGQDGRAFYNLPRLVKVLAGYAWQEHTARRTLEERLDRLEARLTDTPPPSRWGALGKARARRLAAESAGQGRPLGWNWARAWESLRRVFRSATDKQRRD
jgi:hypothetical protein